MIFGSLTCTAWAGKFRPRLVDLAGSNGDALVRSVSRKAFARLTALLAKHPNPMTLPVETVCSTFLPVCKAAVADLSELKGVGPATASLILAAVFPNIVAFFADEVSFMTEKPVMLKNYSCFSFSSTGLCRTTRLAIDRIQYQDILCIFGNHLAQSPFSANGDTPRHFPGSLCKIFMQFFLKKNPT